MAVDGTGLSPEARRRLRRHGRCSTMQARGEKRYLATIFLNQDAHCDFAHYETLNICRGLPISSKVVLLDTSPYLIVWTIGCAVCVNRSVGQVADIEREVLAALSSLIPICVPCLCKLRTRHQIEKLTHALPE